MRPRPARLPLRSAPRTEPPSRTARPGRWSTCPTAPPRTTCVPSWPGPTARSGSARRTTGLARLEDGVWSRFGPGDGLPSASVWALAETEGGRVLWVSTDAGSGALRERPLERGRRGPGPARLPGAHCSRPPTSTAAAARQSRQRGRPGALPGRPLDALTRADGLPCRARLEPATAARDEDGTPGLWVGNLWRRPGAPAGRALAGPRQPLGPAQQPRARPGRDHRRRRGAHPLGGDGRRWAGAPHGGPLAHPALGQRPGWPTTASPSSSPSPGRGPHAGVVGGDLRRPGAGPPGALAEPGHAARACPRTWPGASSRRAPRAGRLRVLWVGTHGGGLARLEDGRWTVHDTALGFLPNDLRLEPGPGPQPRRASLARWAGTDGGLARLRERPLERARHALGAAQQPGLERARGNGLGRQAGPSSGPGPSAAAWRDWRTERWTVYDREPGLPDDRVPVLLGETVADDGRRVLWAGTYGGGLARCENGRWSVIDARSGLPNNTVLSLLETAEPGGRTRVGTLGGWRASVDGSPGQALSGPVRDLALPRPAERHHLPGPAGPRRPHLLLHENRGIVRLTPQPAQAGDEGDFALEPVHRGRPAGHRAWPKRGHPVQKPTAAGAPGPAPCGASPCSTRGRRVPDRSPKPLHIERTLLHGKPRPLAPGAALAHHENSLAFEYVLVAHFRDGDTRYRSQLVGLEENPSDWTGDRKREFAGLPAGRYAFRLWGRDHAGNVSGPLEAAFEIRPAPWRTWWAPAADGGAAAALTGGVAYALARARLGRVLEMQRVQAPASPRTCTTTSAPSPTRISILSEVVKSRLGDSRPELLPPLTQVAEGLARPGRHHVRHRPGRSTPAATTSGTLVPRAPAVRRRPRHAGVAWERAGAGRRRARQAGPQPAPAALPGAEGGARRQRGRHAGAARVSFSLKVEEGAASGPRWTSDGAGIEGSLDEAATRPGADTRAAEHGRAGARRVGGSLSNRLASGRRHARARRGAARVRPGGPGPPGDCPAAR